MKLIISFSGRKDGNCDQIAGFIAGPEDRIIYFRDQEIHSCTHCEYQCFDGECKYRGDDVYGIYKMMPGYEKVILVVPMYCGNPSSLYFIFNERGQDFFAHNEDIYEGIISGLYIIGIYGSRDQSPDFIPCLEKWFQCSKYEDHVLGIERHKFGQKMQDSILEVPKVREAVHKFAKI